VAENLISAETPGALTECLKTTMDKPTVRRFEFASLQGMALVRGGGWPCY
jgi:hypothetical protein